MLFVVVVLVGMIHGLSIWQKRCSVDPEIIRKTLHVVMGLVTLSFPWLFTDAWPVLTLSVMSSIFISVIKTSNLEEWKPVVCAKGRSSIGEICFPLAVGLVFLLSRGAPDLYLIPVAILTFADAASAIVGQRFGKTQYGTTEGAKSLEGSLAFSVVAFFASLIPLTCFTDLSFIATIAISLIISILAMMFEAIAWKGLDNLFIPLGAFLVLETHINLPENILLGQLAILTLVFGFVLFSRAASTLNGSGLIGTALFCYLAFSIGGPTWTVLPVILFLSYRFLLPKRFRTLQGVHSVWGVISIASVGVVWLLAAHISDTPEYIFPYAMTFAAHAAIISIAHMRCTGLSRRKLFPVLFAILKAWCLICLPLILLHPTTQIVVLTIFLAPFCIGIPTLLFYLVNTTEVKPTTRPARWWKQASFAAIASAIAMIPLLL